MKNVDRYFIGIALVLGLLGMLFGIWISMDLSGRIVFSPAHAHNNLVGWVAMMLYGLTYRAYPGMREGRLAVIHLILATLGVLGMVAGLLVVFGAQQAGQMPDETIVKIGSILTVVAFLLFMWIFFTRSHRAA